MTTYLSPGVYVEERTLIQPIQGVGTSTAAYIGITADATQKVYNREINEKVPQESRLNKATLITNWLQYTEIFGSFIAGAYLPDVVYAHFLNGGGACYIVSVQSLTAEATIPAADKKLNESFKVSAKEAGPTGNLLKVTIEVPKATAGKSTGPAKSGQKAAAADQDVTEEPVTTDTTTSRLEFILTVGENKQVVSMDPAAANYVGCLNFDKVLISNITPKAIPAAGSYTLNGGQIEALSANDFIGDVAERTGLGSLEVYDEVRLIACPDLMTGYTGSKADKERVKKVQQALIDHCENIRYCFAALDTPPGLNAQEAKEWREYVNFDSSYAAMYYPWVKVNDFTNGKSKYVPPSGHIIGIFNRTDAERGVHKAPANEIPRGVIALENDLTKGEQDMLNPIGINCLRAFSNRGIRLWGARTLSSEGAWRYINVRRLFIYIEASMDAGLQWVVFEPNDPNLWARVRRDVTSFLRTVWRGGALFGTNESEAFYVKCDAELNTPEIRDMGQLIIEVGVCPVKPAEFVIFRLSQWAGPNSAE